MCGWTWARGVMWDGAPVAVVRTPRSREVLDEWAAGTEPHLRRQQRWAA